MIYPLCFWCFSIPCVRYSFSLMIDGLCVRIWMICLAPRLLNNVWINDAFGHKSLAIFSLILSLSKNSWIRLCWIKLGYKLIWPPKFFFFFFHFAPHCCVLALIQIGFIYKWKTILSSHVLDAYLIFPVVWSSLSANEILEWFFSVHWLLSIRLVRFGS